MGNPAIESPFREDKEKKKFSIENWVLDEVRGIIKTHFGVDYDPLKLLQLIGASCNHQPIADADVLDLCEMMLFWMDKQGWKKGPQLLRYYIGENGPPPQDLRLPATYLTEIPGFSQMVCNTHGTLTDRAIKERVLDATNGIFPRKRKRDGYTRELTDEPFNPTYHDPDGNPIQVTASRTPLREGGEETIYYEGPVQFTDPEHKMVLGGVPVVSKATVKSTRLEENKWQIDIPEWTCWASDLGDMNAGDDIAFPITLEDLIPVEYIRNKIYKLAEKQFGISYMCLNQPMGIDNYLLQLVTPPGKTITKTSVVTGASVTYYPQVFRIYIEAWDQFSLNTSCNQYKSYEIVGPPPAPK